MNFLRSAKIKFPSNSSKRLSSLERGVRSSSMGQNPLLKTALGNLAVADVFMVNAPDGQERNQPLGRKVAARSLGIATETDIVRKITAVGANPRKTLVKEIMTPSLVVTTP